MDIIFEGKQDTADAVAQLVTVIQLFKDRYHISQFREIHLSFILVDKDGEDVELVDSETGETYQSFEVYDQGGDLQLNEPGPRIRLVVDNTRRS